MKKNPKDPKILRKKKTQYNDAQNQMKKQNKGKEPKLNTKGHNR